MNPGNLFRSADAVGASFVFTANAEYGRLARLADTSARPENLPLYQFADAASLALPKGCKLVGVELLGEAEELPSWRRAARPTCSGASAAGRRSPARRSRGYTGASFMPRPRPSILRVFGAAKG